MAARTSIGVWEEAHGMGEGTHLFESHTKSCEQDSRL
jgi:hypothetical protein